MTLELEATLPVNSLGRVELTYPTKFDSMELPSLAEVTEAFNAWVSEARRRGCPNDAPVFVAPHDSGRPAWNPHLVVMWNAGPPKTKDLGL